MITYIQAIILGLLQGVTELFPVSSLGHSVILPPLLGWKIDESGAYFLVFLVATHLATSLALLTFFFADWILIIKGFFRSFGEAQNSRIDSGTKEDGKAAVNAHMNKYTRLSWLLIFGTIPAGLVGLIFQNKIQALFSSPRLVAFCLIANGLVLLWMEKLYGNKERQIVRTENHVTHAEQTENGAENAASDGRIARLTWAQSFKVGLAQCVALIPGFSRTGVTQSGGLMVGLSREDSARFAFLLATPIILGAAIVKLPSLLHIVHGGGINVLGPIIAGFAAAFIAAYFSARFLVNYFKTKTLMPFAIYCIVAGVIASIVFVIR